MKCVFCGNLIKKGESWLMRRGKYPIHTKCQMKQEQAEAIYWRKREEAT